MSTQRAIRRRTKTMANGQHSPSRPPPPPSSSGLLAQQAGELRAEAVLAKSFFAHASTLLNGKSSRGA